MINKVSFRNFKAYRSLDLDLEPFTVVVGPNASGKTTLLSALEFCSRAAGGLVSGDELSTVRSYGSTNPVELTVSGKWSGKQGSFRIVGRPGEAIELVGEISVALMTTAILRFEPRQLAQAAYSDELIPTIQSSGSGLAASLAYLKLQQEEVFDSIELALKQVVPSLRRIRLERAAVEHTAVRNLSLDGQHQQFTEKRQVWGHRIVFDMRGAKGVAADEAGEGTLLTLGLLTVLLTPSRPKLILLDDIELALHPAAQAELVHVLREIQKRDPELQIIATSHSPFILRNLEPQEVRMTVMAENGFARCGKLTDHPDFERWRGIMDPGEFWSTVGEDWLKGPQSEAAPHE